MALVFQSRKYIKAVVIFFEEILPESYFKKFYTYAFPLYQAFIQFVYRAKSVFYSLNGNQEDQRMVEKIYQIMPYTLVGIGGLETTYKLSKLMNEEGIEGNFVELGVAKGGCAALMAMVAFESKHITRQVWLFDSFEGLPEPTDDDFGQNGLHTTGEHLRPLPRGSCLGTLEEVHEVLFGKLHLPKDKVVFVKGWFQDTLPVKGKDVGKIAILRIDGDWYESTKHCLEYLYDQVARGGAVIIDDYHSCFGCKKAVDEFIKNRNLNVDMMFDGRGGCYFLKPLH